MKTSAAGAQRHARFYMRADGRGWSAAGLFRCTGSGAYPRARRSSCSPRIRSAQSSHPCAGRLAGHARGRNPRSRPTAPGFNFVNTDRLFAEVAARGHDRGTKLRKQQMMQRRIRQHDAEARIAGRNRRGNRRSVFPSRAGRWGFPRRSAGVLPARRLRNSAQERTRGPLTRTASLRGAFVRATALTPLPSAHRP